MKLLNKIGFETDAETTGTSFHGDHLITTADYLTRHLGKASDGDGGYKVQRSWDIKVLDEKAPFVFSIYDWRAEYEIQSGEVYDYHIGALKENTARAVSFLEGIFQKELRSQGGATGWLGRHWEALDGDLA